MSFEYGALIYDFYYSERQLEIMRALNQRENYINGRLYTERVKKGKNSARRFKDLRFVDTGTSADITRSRLRGA